MGGRISTKRAVTAAATLVIAAAAGHFMQNGAVLPGGFGALPAKPATVTMSAGPQIITPRAPDASGFAEVTRATTASVLVLPSLPNLPSFLPVPPGVEALQLAAITDDFAAQGGPGAPLAAAPDAGCDIGFTAMAAPAAMVALTLEAPCYAGETVTFTHSGLRFTETLDAAGLVQVSAPAMAENAVFAAGFADGQAATVELPMPTLADYARVALVWQGRAGLQLHALEDGADYGEAGHLWAEAPGAPDRATSGEGGYMTMLGSVADGYAADIYTYPGKPAASGPAPDIRIEAQVLDSNCTDRITGTFLRADAGETPVVSPLIMAVPGCDAVGEYLVLKIPPLDLRIARN